MLIKKTRGWDIAESSASPEEEYSSRRRFLQTSAAAAASVALGARSLGATDPSKKPSPSGLHPAKRNDRFEISRPMTDEKLAATHNIFDEFGSDRTKIWTLAEGFVTHPWRIHIGGAVEKNIEIDAIDLQKKLGIEERLYRHRCVEAWSMVVPWSGIPLARFVAFAKPLEKARYLRMISYGCAETLPGWYASRRVFPYYESLTLDEATNELAFLATGIYGHALPPQHGAPIRLVVPWKYGLKSIKSIVAFQFTREKPGTFWNDLAPHNYSWESNVDPTATHPWPQARETPLGSEDQIDTLPFNGYGELVAHLYR